MKNASVSADFNIESEAMLEAIATQAASMAGYSESEAKTCLGRWRAKWFPDLLCGKSDGQSIESRPFYPSRLVLFPKTFRSQRAAAILSSQRSQAESRQQLWYDYLRTALTRICNLKFQVVSADGMTCDRLVRRGAELFQLVAFKLRLAADKNPQDWISRLLESSPGRMIEIAPGADKALQFEKDAWGMCVCQHLFVIGLKHGGKTHRFLEKVLDDNRKQVFVAMHDHLIDAKTRYQLLDQGAIGWHLIPNKPIHHREGPNRLDLVAGPCRHSAGDFSTSECLRDLTPSSELVFPERKEDRTDLQACEIFDSRQVPDLTDFLFHCTRAQPGAWPDQEDSHYLDELLFGSITDRSPLATLCRILLQKKLIGGARLTRGTQPMVSFTAMTLPEIVQHRTFRSHLSRWDFEPYGIGFHRRALLPFGLRRVRYGVQAQGKQLTSADLPFFQLATTRTPTGKEIDWTSEKEWRIPRELRFAAIPAGDVVVFVKNWEDARVIRQVCDYRVVVLAPTNLDPLNS